MQIKDLIVSYDLAVELKKRGFKAKTYFIWRDRPAKLPPVCHVDIDIPASEKYCAPTCGELGILLPFYYPFIWNSFCDNEGGSLHFKDTKIEREKYFEERTEQEARASALIWLHDNGYIDISRLEL